MKVLHISYALSWGGGEQQMVNIIEGVAVMGVENSIICPESSKLESYFKNKPVYLIPLKIKKGINFSFLKKLQKTIQSISPDIMHIHTGKFLKDFLFISLFDKKKYHVIFTMNGMIRKKSFLSKKKYNNKRIDKYLCISEAVEKNFIDRVLDNIQRNKTIVVYDGIEINNSSDNYSIPDELKKHHLTHKIVGNIANHNDAKDLMTFFKTVNYIVKEKNRNDIVFIQIGRKTKRTKDYQEYINSNNLNSNIKIVGFKNDAQNYLSQFNCFLMTSQREGLSMAILEAFSKNVPVVATNAGGIPEAVINKETGLLSKKGDYKRHILIAKDKNRTNRTKTRQKIAKA